MLKEIPTNIKDAIDLYVDKGIQPGSFTTAVLANDLKGAFGRADVISERNMKQIVSYVYNNIPSLCQGSYDKVDNWIKRGGIDGFNKEHN